MSRNVSTIMIPAERGEQLRRLVAFYGVSAAELLDEWISSAIAETGVSDALPGYEVLACADEGECFVHFSAIACPIVGLNPTEARAFAEALEGTSYTTNPPSAALKTADGCIIAVVRHGRGMRMLIKAEGYAEAGKRVMSRALARDLARQLRREAGKLDSPAA
ncbi:hypothetical protein [Azospirillum sp. SYSU D00513]|uniref:hypothetical protein n=1 Tax=Azospirillum sp. SYSU D00513 TaxID=2812561 RepID=UPI001A970D69|nr:hypothetical protein [Azospirillum sp. SYSU D00513]